TAKTYVTLVVRRVGGDVASPVNDRPGSASFPASCCPTSHRVAILGGSPIRTRRSRNTRIFFRRPRGPRIVVRLAKASCVAVSESHGPSHIRGCQEAIGSVP